MGAFGRSLIAIAQLIKADVGLESPAWKSMGWEHPRQQGRRQIRNARRADCSISPRPGRVRQDLGDHMDEVMVLTMTEFGRAARQNGDRGTGPRPRLVLLRTGRRRERPRSTQLAGPCAAQVVRRTRPCGDTDFRDVFAEVCTLTYGFANKSARQRVSTILMRVWNDSGELFGFRQNCTGRH